MNIWNQVPLASQAPRAAFLVGILAVVCAERGYAAPWTENVHPGVHHHHAVAYDEARDRLVLFGGQTDELYNADTYEWDGQRWHRVNSVGPPFREGHNMAYHAGRQRVVMFGGFHTDLFYQVYVNDTWEWDGIAWTQVANTGPAPRAEHAMAYDAARDRIVLFGGMVATDEGGVIHYGDTWVWDTMEWTRVGDGNGPSARRNAAMSYDAANNRVVLFGGLDAVDYVGDTWEWDGQSWTLVTTTGPPCRAFHTMAYDRDRERIVVFGGASPCVNWPFVADQQDTWEWDGRNWTEMATTGPFKRRLAAMAYDSARQRTILLGGWPASFLPDGGGPLQTDIPLGDLWEWDGQTWEQRVATIPRGRMAHRMVHDPIRGVTVMFGGRASIYFVENETWEWDGQGWTRRTLGGPTGPNNPQERVRHSMAYDSQRQVVWMFGGSSFGTVDTFDETWSWDGVTWMVHDPQTKPTARYRHGMVYDTARDRLVLFGGIGNSGLALGDTWEFDGADWTFRTADGPVPRFDHGMAYDDAPGRVVLFGGWDSTVSNVPHGDTWEWDGSSWELVSQTGPSIRAGMAIAYDSDRQRVIIRGGVTNDGGTLALLNDTWEWDGGEWTLVTDEGPGTRYHEAMVYEPSQAEMFLFGGTDFNGNVGPYLGDMWTLQSEGRAIPTVSEWGMVVVTLLVMTAGTLALARRRLAVAPENALQVKTDTPN